MAFKGKSTIELRNAETGELEFKTEDENMVTNAAYNLVNGPTDWSLANSTLINGKIQFNPLLKSCFSGLLLFSENLQEDVSLIIPPSRNKMIGKAAGVYLGEDSFQGTLNQSESKEINDGKGYRFVWDFATDKANGTVKSVSLTSFAGGQSGFESDCISVSTPERRAPIGKGTFNLQDISSPFSPQILINNPLTDYCFVGLIEKNSYIYANTVEGGNTVTFKTIKYGNSMHLTTNNDVRQTEKTLSTSLKLCRRNNIHQEDDRLYSVRVYDTNKIDFVIFDGKTLEIISETTYTVQDVTFATEEYQRKNSLYHDEYFYIYKDLYTVYKINAKDISDYELFESFENSRPGYNAGYRTMVVDNLLLFYEYANPNYEKNSNVYVYNGESLTKLYSDTSDKLYPADMYTVNSKSIKRPYILFGKYDNSVIYLGLFTPFLSTINNLSTPVVKNETQTMKVTYEITEI